MWPKKNVSKAAGVILHTSTHRDLAIDPGERVNSVTAMAPGCGGITEVGVAEWGREWNSWWSILLVFLLVSIRQREQTFKLQSSYKSSHKTCWFQQAGYNVSAPEEL
jgi:hypothetical protein